MVRFNAGSGVSGGCPVWTWPVATKSLARFTATWGDGKRGEQNTSQQLLIDVYLLIINFTDVNIDVDQSIHEKGKT